MTKVIILGETPKEEKKKPIEFKHFITDEIGGVTSLNPTISPSSYAVVELVKKGKDGRYDIMFAYDKNRSLGTLYLGHFNDGVVE